MYGSLLYYSLYFCKCLKFFITKSFLSLHCFLYLYGSIPRLSNAASFTTHSSYPSYTRQHTTCFPIPRYLALLLLSLPRMPCFLLPNSHSKSPTATSFKKSSSTPSLYLYSQNEIVDPTESFYSRLKKLRNDLGFQPTRHHPNLSTTSHSRRHPLK